MPAILSRNNRYPGLYWTALQIGHYIPQKKFYVEPFSGYARTAKYAKSDIVILNDRSEHANNKCRETFPNAKITNEDFVDSIRRWDSMDTFFLIDPPWRVDFYKKDRSYVDRTAASYLYKLDQLLPNIKGDWIVTLGTYCKWWLKLYSKKVRHHKQTMFKGHAETMMYSNKPLNVQVPQLL